MSNVYNLWKLLKEYEVVIPVIQRDYAQGRVGKEYIRRSFLSELKQHIEANEKITLDFIYGNMEGNQFLPLDGQQRLTTLWLIHWYISFKSGNLKNDAEVLSKFKYKTRNSSKDFCKALCEKMNSYDGDDLVKYIKSQTWFLTSWLKDPTVSGMLRTIGDNENSKDNIVSIFEGVDYETYRTRLIEEQVIDFKLIVMGNDKLPISDDLYIKMNARGKCLTDFENFKADLVSWMQSPKNPDIDKYNHTINEGESNGISYKQYYPAQIDNEWMDLFWNSTKQGLADDFNGKIDDIYFAFINRFVVTEICMDSTINAAEYAAGKENKSNKEKLELFSNLTSKETEYKGFHTYCYGGKDNRKSYFSYNFVNRLDYVIRTLGNDKILTDIENALKIIDNDEDTNKTDGYAFIPRYKKQNNDKYILNGSTQKERVYFLAVILYILNTKACDNFDEVSFNRWMRVVRNLTENGAIYNMPAMVTCMRTIKVLADELEKFGNDIYTVLINQPDVNNSSRLELQLQEEKEKAQKIIDDMSWEDKIIEAEKYSFFNGTIRFLYHDDKGNNNWDDFDEKYEKAKKLFGSKVICSTTVHEFLECFESLNDIWEERIFTSIGYHPRNKCWKTDILCNLSYAKQVDMLLLEKTKPVYDALYRDFLVSGLVEKIVVKYENYRYRYRYYNSYAVHKEYSATEAVYITEDRKKRCVAFKSIVDSGVISICDPQFNSYHGGYYWGAYVDFIYKGTKYRWQYSGHKDNAENTIYQCVNGIDWKDKMYWMDENNLISEIDTKYMK